MTIKWIGLTDIYHVGEMAKINNLARKMEKTINWMTSKEEVMKKLSEESETILFIKVNETFDAYSLTKELTSLFSFIAIIIIDFNQAINLKKALRSGASDIIDSSSTEQETVEAIQELEKQLGVKLTQKIDKQNDNKAVKSGKVIPISSMKGGVGKTTISTNLATAMVKHSIKVAVIDLDLQSGDVAMLLDIKPKVTIYDWITSGMDENNMKQYMLKHSSGVEVVAAPLRLELAEKITIEHITKLISLLKKHYDIVIVDTPPQLSEKELAILEHADEIMVIVNKDLPTLKNSKIYLDTLSTLGLQPKVKVLLNRESRNTGVDDATVENILGHPIFATIPNEEKLVILSINKGIPFVISDAKSKISISIFKLTNKLLNLSVEGVKKNKRSIFKRWLKVRG